MIKSTEPPCPFWLRESALACVTGVGPPGEMCDGQISIMPSAHRQVQISLLHGPVGMDYQRKNMIELEIHSMFRRLHLA